MRFITLIGLGMVIAGCFGQPAEKNEASSLVVDYTALNDNHYCSYYIQTLTVWVDGTPRENALSFPCSLGHAVLENVTPGNHWIFMEAHGLESNTLLMSQTSMVTIPESGPTQIFFDIR